MSESIYRELINRAIDKLGQRKLYRVEYIFTILKNEADADDVEVNQDTAKTSIRRRIWNGPQGGSKRGKAFNPQYDRLDAAANGMVCRIESIIRCPPLWTHRSLLLHPERRPRFIRT